MKASVSITEEYRDEFNIEEKSPNGNSIELKIKKNQNLFDKGIHPKNIKSSLMKTEQKDEENSFISGIISPRSDTFNKITSPLPFKSPHNHN